MSFNAILEGDHLKFTANGVAAYTPLSHYKDVNLKRQLALQAIIDNIIAGKGTKAAKVVRCYEAGLKVKKSDMTTLGALFAPKRKPRKAK